MSSPIWPRGMPGLGEKLAYWRDKKGLVAEIGVWISTAGKSSCATLARPSPLLAAFWLLAGAKVLETAKAVGQLNYGPHRFLNELEKS